MSTAPRHWTRFSLLVLLVLSATLVYTTGPSARQAGATGALTQSRASTDTAVATASGDMATVSVPAATAPVATATATVPVATATGTAPASLTSAAAAATTRKASSGERLELGPLPPTPIASKPLAPPAATPGGGLAHPLAIGPMEVGAPATCAAPASKQTLATKVLVVSNNGTEADLPAIAQAMDYMGAPYDLYIASTTSLYSSATGTGFNLSTNGVKYGPSVTEDVLTAAGLSNGTQTQGNYDGVILASSNVYALPEISALINYQHTFCTRTVVWYAYPQPALGYQSPDLSPFAGFFAPTATFTSDGAGIFTYVNTVSGLPISSLAYTYLAPAASDAYLQGVGVGGHSTPLLTSAGSITETDSLGLIHSDPAGAQTLSLTFDSSPVLTHTLVLAYGLINWVAHGAFLGERHVYLSPQLDDVFIDDDEWLVKATGQYPACGTATDAQGNAAYRMTGADLSVLDSWLTSTHALIPTAQQLGISFAFNGAGYVNPTGWGGTVPDSLATALPTYQPDFNWINHTYDHGNLGTWTVPISNSDALTDTTLTYQQELADNDAVAMTTTLTNYYKGEMVNPEYSGLTNPTFLATAVAFGIQYVVGDSSHTGATTYDTDPTDYNNPSPNTGNYNQWGAPSILMIPRHPTNLYYNVTNQGEWVAEDNCFYPSGSWYVGGSDPADLPQSYQNLLSRESSTIVTYMLNGDMDPLMFHMANLRAYDGTHSVFTDLMNATIDKYQSYFNLPIESPSMKQIGQRMAARAQYNAAGIAGFITRGTAGNWQTITLTATTPVTVPVTGLNAAGAEQYGGQPIAHLALAAGQSLTCSLLTGSCGSAATIPIAAGWNLITLPISPTTTQDAQSMLAALNRLTPGGYAEIASYSSGGWSAGVYDDTVDGLGMSSNNFNLQMGRGYALYSDRAGSIDVIGVAVGAQHVPLSAGWNLIGFPEATSTTGPDAYSILSGLLTANGGSYAEIDGYTGGRWAPSAHDGAGALLPTGGTFRAQPGRGYAVFTDKSTM